MKRILLSLLLLVGMTTAGLAQTPIIMGDMNRDGEITISDVTSLVNVLLGKSPMQYITRDDFGTPVTGITLDKTSLALKVGDTATLTATVTPDDATQKGVSWTSSNTAVATVSEAGVVTAVSDGTATITATTVDGGFTATCTVTVNPDGPQYVEMAPGFYWATTNVGADNPWDFGDYFAWGETMPKTDYSESTYDYSASFADAATAERGDNWHMPTEEEWAALNNTDNFTWKKITNYEGTGVAGYTVTSKVSGYEGNQIFLPTAGYYNGTSIPSNSSGKYWSSTLNTSNSNKAQCYCWDPSLGLLGVVQQFRYLGASVRPVYDPYYGHKFVEMGDGLRWATMNVGANSPEEYGDYFAWGETEPKTDYSWATYKHMYPNMTDGKGINKYQADDGQTSAMWYYDGTFTGDGKTSFEDYAYEDDAARKNWGGYWRTPTREEWDNLLDTNKFIWSYTDNYNGTGVSGTVVTSRIPGYVGNQIFFPAAGRSEGTTLSYPGVRGCYWTSEINATYSFCAIYTDIQGSSMSPQQTYRNNGLSVRAVAK